MVYSLHSHQEAWKCKSLPHLHRYDQADWVERLYIDNNWVGDGNIQEMHASG